MSWRKLGRIWAPDGGAEWARSHALYPTAELRSPTCLRVYVTCLDAQSFGRGGYVDLDPGDPRRVVGAAERPILDLGPIGDFDDCGANPFAVVQFQGRRLMYYLGWQRLLRAPYASFTGLAFECDDGRFQKWSRTPVLERTPEEPHIRGAPCVLAAGETLRMWYVASGSWTSGPTGLVYHVSIRHAVSEDSLVWRRTPEPCLEPRAGEYALGRPSVVREGGLYRMWYSVRAFERPYAIGYAESDDGLVWRRMDDRAGIGRSEAGWDSEMICFPNVIDAGERRLLFYNGNRHGQSGFGCAEWIED